ncbi:MAG: hypothetical protein DPW18_20490 [Chloroflexi bacterium]|nr:hypothetical protein [Chloroflexota bacterium]MDL1942194.1 hypothetical protein [Chloroflexi bacterium CFX2]
MQTLPPNFVNNIQSTFGEQGREWLERLPNLIADASARWGLTEVQPVPNLSYNFAAFAKHPSLPAPLSQGEGSVILKIGVPHRELLSEMAALKLFDGNGVCQLLECDEERGMFLLERLEPGRMLADLEDDDERTHIAVDVMQALWARGGILAAGDGGGSIVKFIQLSDWFDELKNIRPQFEGGTGPFPKAILERVEASLPELFDDEMSLIHGDFHHFNVLSSARGWLAVDPKGVIGPAGYEIGPLMINPWGSLMDGNRLKVQTERRVDILRERLGWERGQIIQWSLAHAVLSAWWDYPNLDWEYSLYCAEVFSEVC